jgi:hypothetical protein
MKSKLIDEAAALLVDGEMVATNTIELEPPQFLVTHLYNATFASRTAYAIPVVAPGIRWVSARVAAQLCPVLLSQFLHGDTTVYI